MVEEGYTWPGTMGGLGQPQQYVRSHRLPCDAMAIWQSGRTWYQLAPVARLTLTGKAPVGATGKDVILALCALFKSDVLNHAVEINGTPETLASIPIEAVLPSAICLRNGEPSPAKRINHERPLDPLALRN